MIIIMHKKPLTLDFLTRIKDLFYSQKEVIFTI